MSKLQPSNAHRAINSETLQLSLKSSAKAIAKFPLPPELITQVLSHVNEPATGDFNMAGTNATVPVINPFIKYTHLNSVWSSAVQPMLYRDINLGGILCDSASAELKSHQDGHAAFSDAIAKIKTNQLLIRTVTLIADRSEFFPEQLVDRYADLALQMAWLDYIAPQHLEEVVIDIGEGPSYAPLRDAAVLYRNVFPLLLGIQESPKTWHHNVKTLKVVSSSSVSFKDLNWPQSHLPVALQEFKIDTDLDIWWNTAPFPSNIKSLQVQTFCDLSHLTKLQHLDLGGTLSQTRSSRNVPRLPTSLVTLKIARERLRSLANLKKLANLQVLDLSSIDLSPQFHARNLPINMEILSLQDCHLTRFGNLHHLWKLKQLNLSHNDLRKSWHPKLLPSSLHYLNVTSCQLLDTGDLTHIRSLDSLEITSNKLGESFDANLLPKGLKFLNISKCAILALNNIQNLASLECLIMSQNAIGMNWSVPLLSSSLLYLDIRCCEIVDFGPMERLISLQCLSGLTDLSYYYVPGKLPASLRYITIYDAINIGKITENPSYGLQEFALQGRAIGFLWRPHLMHNTLTKLHIGECDIEDVGDLRHLIQLQDLDLHYNLLERWTPDNLPRSLHKLNIKDCEIKDLGDLTQLIHLRELVASGNRFSETWNAENLPTSLVALDVASCELQRIGNMLHLQHLQILCLDENRGLECCGQNLPPTLRTLLVCYCGFYVLSGIEHLVHLKELHIF